MTAAEIQRIYSEAEQIYTATEVEAAIAKIGAAITVSFSDKNPIIRCLMKGAVVVTGKLLPLLDFPLQLEYVEISRYRGGTHGDTPLWKKAPPEAVRRRHVLIVDDILDEGVTLMQTIDACYAMQAKSVGTAVLIDKKIPMDRAYPRADFTGLTAPNHYLFGYGMDYKDYLRNAPGIYAIKDHE